MFCFLKTFTTNRTELFTFSKVDMGSPVLGSILALKKERKQYNATDCYNNHWCATDFFGRVQIGWGSGSGTLFKKLLVQKLALKTVQTVEKE